MRSMSDASSHQDLRISASLLTMQEESAAKLVKNWRGLAAVWLSFGTNSFTDKFTAARSSLETTYAYEPVAAKVSSPLLCKLAALHICPGSAISNFYPCFKLGLAASFPPSFGRQRWHGVDR